MSEDLTFLTPPQIAKRLHVKPSKVIAWIRSGELRGSDVSEKPGQGRPRYRVSLADFLAFLNRRAEAAPTKKPRPQKRRRNKDPEFVEFF